MSAKKKSAPPRSPSRTATKAVKKKTSLGQAATASASPNVEDARPAVATVEGHLSSAPPGGKLSALAAAARVLGEEGRSMNCRALIESMAAKGYWTSPAGKTPNATLYAALLKEVTTKGEQSRFAKVDRGQFALRDARS